MWGLKRRRNSVKRTDTHTVIRMDRQTHVQTNQNFLRPQEKQERWQTDRNTDLCTDRHTHGQTNQSSPRPQEKQERWQTNRNTDLCTDRHMHGQTNQSSLKPQEKHERCQTDKQTHSHTSGQTNPSRLSSREETMEGDKVNASCNTHEVGYWPLCGDEGRQRVPVHGDHVPGDQVAKGTRCQTEQCQVKVIHHRDNDLTTVYGPQALSAAVYCVMLLHVALCSLYMELCM